MVTSRPEDLRRVVADRVAQRVAGRGVSRAAVDAAVGSVFGALESRRAASGGSQASGSGPDTALRMFSQIGTDAISNVLKEFWPDVKKKWQARKKH